MSILSFVMTTTLTTAPTARTTTMNHPSNPNKRHFTKPLSEFKPNPWAPHQLDQWAKDLAATDGLILSINIETEEYRGFDDWSTSTNAVAVVWHPATGRAARRTLHSFSGVTDTLHTPFAVNATPEVLEAYAKWYTEAFLPDQAQQFLAGQQRVRRSKIEARMAEIQSSIRRGDTVTVVRGRKHPKGLTGKVFWLGQDNFGNTKAGVATSDRRDTSGRNIDVIWVAVANLDKVVVGEEAKVIAELTEELAALYRPAYTAKVVADFVRENAAVGTLAAKYWWNYSLDTLAQNPGQATDCRDHHGIGY